MDIKKDILWRVYLVYICVCLFAIFIIARVAVIQFSEGDHWRSYADSLRIKEIDIEAARGNIFAADGSLLATSVPFYEVAMDVNTDFLTNERFDAPADTLAQKLSQLFGDRSKREYRQLLENARKSGSRYVLIKRNVSYKQLQEMKKFPILKYGRNKGGFIFTQTNKRERPFRMLAARTIGYDRDSIAVGLEAGYREYLKGTDGKRLMKKIAGGVWMPLRDQNEIEPEDGSDLITTIDVNIQDVATNALLKSLIKHQAAYGCVVLMEVKTGEVKAIANLTRKDSTRYEEDFNYAIGASTEPGSTFKLVSYMAVMEDYGVKLTDKVNVGDGTKKFFDRTMRDSHKPDKPVMTVQEAFETSSNVGVAEIVTKYYGKDPQKFIDRLYAMSVNTKLGFNIPGEGRIKIKNTSDGDWSGISLPWISHGYEVLLTPIKMLAIYNAVANDGKMVRPRFVKEVRKYGKTVKKFDVEVINPAICSKETIEKAKRMMEGVVQNGTAKTLKAATYAIAGKTGTALVAQNGIYKPIAGRANYQASFVGYFPADNPKYSCIVIVNAPSGDAYYGGVVAGPIFKEIADKVYSSSLEIHREINRVNPQYAKKAPAVKNGYQPELEKVLTALKVKTSKAGRGAWTSASTRDSVSLQLSPSKVEADLKKGVVPNVVGMTVKDALYLLENHGMNVRIKGRGVISRQSLQAGTKYDKGTQITLELS